MAGTEERYVFHTEWFDQQADVIRRYMMTYYPRDNSVSMYDTKNHRAFLKRTEYAEITLANMYIGSVLTVLARQLKIVEYADDYTRSAMEHMKCRTLALIKPDAYNNIGRILAAVTQSGLVVAKLKMIRMDSNRAAAFTNMQAGLEAAGPEHAQLLTSDVVVAMELVGTDAINMWQAMMGPFSPAQAKSEAPRSIRAALGTDDVRNAVHGSSNSQIAEQELAFFFGEGAKWPTTALFNNCTLCVVRPHAFVSSGGEIVSRILAEGFEISAMCLWHLDKASAEEFCEVYKGVLPEYHDMVSQLGAGGCLVMEIRQEDAVNAFRKLAGPHDPEVAKHLRPNTLRAQYGKDRVHNAVHATDLPEDGLLEVEYFFNILYARN
jgi:nucleoside-diphosphate kinase